MICRCSNRADQQGIRLLDPPVVAVGPGLWLRDPAGLLIQIRLPIDLPPCKSPSIVPLHRKEFAQRRARRYGGRASSAYVHALFLRLTCPRRWLLHDVLGLRLSDHPGPVAFLHSMHGSDHHLIAFAQSSMVSGITIAPGRASINEIGLGAMQMATRVLRAVGV